MDGTINQIMATPARLWDWLGLDLNQLIPDSLPIQDWIQSPGVLHRISQVSVPLGFFLECRSGFGFWSVFLQSDLK